MLPFPWRQGEHLTITGDTGSGKTTLANALLYARRSTISIKSKADKAPLPGEVVDTNAKFQRVREQSDGSMRAVLYPGKRIKAIDTLWGIQYREINAAIQTIWKEGHWTVYFDELFYLCDRLRLDNPINMLLTQGRSNDITVVCGMQRPVGVTRYALSQATHVISFSAERRDIKTLAEICGDDFGMAIAKLPRYHFAWYYRPERKVWVGDVSALLDNA